MGKLTFILEDDSGNNTTMTKTRHTGDFYSYELSEFLDSVYEELRDDLKQTTDEEVIERIERINKKISNDAEWPEEKETAPDVQQQPKIKD